MHKCYIYCINFHYHYDVIKSIFISSSLHVLYQSQTKEMTVSAFKAITMWHCWCWGAEHHIPAVTCNIQNGVIYAYRGDWLCLMRQTVMSAKSTRSPQISPDRPSLSILASVLKTDSLEVSASASPLFCCRSWLGGFSRPWCHFSRCSCRSWYWISRKLDFPQRQWFRHTDV